MAFDLASSTFDLVKQLVFGAIDDPSDCAGGGAAGGVLRVEVKEARKRRLLMETCARELGVLIDEPERLFRGALDLSP